MFERLVVKSVVELHFGLFYFFCLIHDDVVTLSAFLRFKAGFFKAITSLRD